MWDGLKRSIQQLEPPACPNCRFEMRWHGSQLKAEAATGTIVHLFACPNCSQIADTDAA
jgi:hypothetical protein